MATARKRGAMAPKLLQKATQKKKAKKAPPPKPPGLAVGDVVVWRRAYPNDWMELRVVKSVKRTASLHYLRVTIGELGEEKGDRQTSTVFSWSVSQRRGRYGTSFSVQYIEPLTPELEERIAVQMLVARAASVFDPTDRARAVIKDWKFAQNLGALVQLKGVETALNTQLQDLRRVISAAEKLLRDIEALRVRAKHLT
jgi:hypothetical protein